MTPGRARHRRATAAVPRETSPLPRHRARKRFGQHFLQPAWAARVVQAIAPQPDEVFLEVGPGTGAITLPLLAGCRHVIAFEIDRDLAARWRAEARPNLTIVEGDVLAVTGPQITDLLAELGLGDAPLRLAGNLPYNVASPVIFKCLELYEAGLPLRDATVMLQREVAERLLAAPGTGEYGVLSVMLRQVAAVARRLQLPPGAFRPVPEVHSTLVTLQWHPPAPAPRDLPLFRSLVRAVFTRRRKTLGNALQAWNGRLDAPPAAVIAAAGLDPQRRPEALDLADFVRLADAVAAARRP